MHRLQIITLISYVFNYYSKSEKGKKRTIGSLTQQLLGAEILTQFKDYYGGALISIKWGENDSQVAKMC